jgi:hypothetical protein
MYCYCSRENNRSEKNQIEEEVVNAPHQAEELNRPLHQSYCRVELLFQTLCEHSRAEVVARVPSL